MLPTRIQWIIVANREQIAIILSCRQWNSFEHSIPMKLRGLLLLLCVWACSFTSPSLGFLAFANDSVQNLISIFSSASPVHFFFQFYPFIGMNVGFCVVAPLSFAHENWNGLHKEVGERHRGIVNVPGREWCKRNEGEDENNEMIGKKETRKIELETPFIHQCTTESTSKPWFFADWGRRFTRFIRNFHEE